MSDVDMTNGDDHDCPYSFEPTIPWECGLQLVSIVRDGQLMDRKWEAVQIGCGTVGCIAKAIQERQFGAESSEFGEQLETAKIDVRGLTIEECCDRLEQKASSASPEAVDLDPTWIALIMQIVRLLLERL